MSPWSIYVTGATGYLGHEVARELRERGMGFEALSRAEGFDLLDLFGLEQRVDERFASASGRPLLLHLAAWSRQGPCEAEPELAYRANAEATAVLATCVRRRGGRMLYTSTDLVFDGENAPYAEDDEAAPLSVYGRSKLLGESYLLHDEHAVICRVPLLYGPSFDGARGASDSLLRAAREGKEIRLFEDEWRTPLDVRECARRLVELALDEGVHGVRHLPGPERLSRVELGERVLAEAGLEARVARVSRLSMPGGPRAADCSLRDSFASLEAPES